MEIITGSVSIQSILESNRSFFKNKFGDQIREDFINNFKKNIQQLQFIDSIVCSGRKRTRQSCDLL